MSKPESPERSLCVIGGFAPTLEAALGRRMEAAIAGLQRPIRVTEERVPAAGLLPAAVTPPQPAAFLLDIFDAVQRAAGRGASAVVLPVPLPAAELRRLRAYCSVPIIEPLEVLQIFVRSRHPTVRCVGVVPAPVTRHVWDDLGVAAAQTESAAVGRVDTPLRLIVGEGLQSAAELRRQGAELLVLADGGAAALQRTPAAEDASVIDLLEILVHHVLEGEVPQVSKRFKIGVVGGIGPAATLDFLQKVVRHTPARRDQDHLPIVVEQNPQIPDRTAHLLGSGEDPTLALYATCKQLELSAADVIAIPCNTAHAFLDRFQSRLQVPIENMLTVTVQHLRETFPGLHRVGLLATTGTIASNVYGAALAAAGMQQIVPSSEPQARVMNAIYGPHGVKAGHTLGECVDDAASAMEELASAGVEVVILGCTELPLIFREPEFISRTGKRLSLIDPTDILASRCVARALAATGRPS